MPTSDRCPHCRKLLTIKQIIEMMNGSGFVRRVKIRLPDGTAAWLDARDVNPNAMEIVQDIGEPQPVVAT
jgi:hypothetical protein